MNNAILLLGSNLGDTEKNISIAINHLENIGKTTKKTVMLKNKPVEYESKNIFCNLALVFETELSPMKLLEEIKKIEQKMGRNIDSRELGQYSDRVIDIDIVSYEDIIFESKKLELPHRKHFYERDFSQKLLNELKNI